MGKIKEQIKCQLNGGMLNFNGEKGWWKVVYNKIYLKQINFLIDIYDPIEDIFQYKYSGPKI